MESGVDFIDGFMDCLCNKIDGHQLVILRKTMKTLITRDYQGEV